MLHKIDVHRLLNKDKMTNHDEESMNHFSRLKRLPPYVFTTMAELKQEILATGAAVFDLGLGNPDQPTALHIVEALQQAATNPELHRYADPRGTLRLREAIAGWYGKQFNVDLDPKTECLVTIGSKEGLAHLALALLAENDHVLVPNPCYPVHYFGCVLAGATVHHIPMSEGCNFLETLEKAILVSSPKPKMMILNFPANPTTQCVDIDFFEKIVCLAREHQIWIVHDFAYAQIVFDGYRAPSILEVKGAKEIAVETYTLSKSYNMAGWRVGFVCGNTDVVNALAKIKSYIDYGSFAPVQIAAIAALEGPDDCVQATRACYQHRRDYMVKGLRAMGWEVTPPKATMFLWLKIPKPFAALGSLEFAKLLLREAKVVVSPGIGFGEYGNEFVRISLVANDQNMQQILANLQKFLRCEFNLPAHLEHSFS